MIHDGDEWGRVENLMDMEGPGPRLRSQLNE